MRQITPNNKKRFNKIYIEITNICNLHCSFCPDSKGKKQFMHIKDFEHILKEIKPYTNVITLHVKGEPLMHPNINEILNLCDKYQIYVNLTTNGTLLQKNINHLIKHPYLRQINISIHSLNENNSNDTIFFNNYLENLIECIERIQFESNAYVSLRLWNLSNIKENDKNFNILNFLSNKFNIPNLIFLAKEKNFVELAPHVFLNQDLMFNWPNLDNLNLNLESIRGTCYGCRNQIAILVNGSIVPCCIDQNADILLGNIFEENLDRILNSDKVNKIITEFEQNIISNPLCINCGFRKKFD